MNDAELIAAGGLLAFYAATGKNDGMCLGGTLADAVEFELRWRRAASSGKPLHAEDCTHYTHRRLNTSFYCNACAKEMK